MATIKVVQRVEILYRHTAACAANPMNGAALFGVANLATGPLFSLVFQAVRWAAMASSTSVLGCPYMPIES